MKKIPATVITGFLGAGKTTLIRHLIEHAGGRRLALIINEFGDVGVDGALVQGCGDEACPDESIIALATGRSEEHTSGPQSLLRRSCAVSCLHKKQHRRKS